MDVPGEYAVVPDSRGDYAHVHASDTRLYFPPVKPGNEARSNVTTLVSFSDRPTWGRGSLVPSRTPLALCAEVRLVSRARFLGIASPLNVGVN